MKRIKYLIFPILLLISFSITYAIFSSSKSGSRNVSAANWLVKLETIDDEIDITGGRQNINFGLCEKFMPGNPCVLPLNIDATLTEVDTVVTLEIGEIVGATKEELDLAGVSFKISDGVNEGYSYNVGYRTKKNLNLVIDWELGNINDTNKTNADLNLSKIQNNITVPVSIIVRQALNTPRTVTFNTHVERISNPSSIEVIEGLTISNIPVITDNEYEFEGWYTKEKGGVKLTNNTIITDDITYHAHYSNIRTITFNSYGGSNIDDIEVLSGNTISTLPTPTKFGYTFNGWYTNIVGGEQLTSSTEITSDRTYYAHWVTKYYTLTFNSDGSSVSPIQVQEGESLSSSNISIPTSEKDGYTFEGWFNNSEELTTSKQILSDITYTASWTANTYTITYNNNGSVGTMQNQSFTYDTPQNLILNGFEKKGYTFAGWSTSSTDIVKVFDTNEYSYSNTGSGYYDIKQYSIAAPFSSGDIYQLDYDAKGNGELITYFYGAYNYLQVSNWTNSNGDSGNSTDGSNSFDLTSSYKHYSVRFTLGNTGDGNVVKYLLFRIYPGANTTFKNIRFVKVGSNSKLYMNNESVNNLTIQNNDQIDLYAIWSPNTYTVTFDYDGATGNNSTSSKMVTYDSTYGTLPTPTRTGYTFEGWNGKNMLNMNEWLNSFSGARNGTVVKGNNSITITATGYDCYTNTYADLEGENYKITVKPNTTYTLSWQSSDMSISGSNFVFINNISDSTHFRYVGQQDTNKLIFTTTSDAEFITFRLGVEFSGQTVTYSNLQLEENTDATSYEPYYVTSSTNVTQSKNHTLKALWTSVMTNNQIDYDYSGTYKEFIAPQTGTYKIELWGASGGSPSNVNYGGNGAYTSGQVYLSKGEKIYVNVGQAGTSAYSQIDNSYNGGGKGNGSPDGYYYAASGGGSTDIRLTNGSWDNFDSLKSRIMVAGAGGGGFSYQQDNWYGGIGGSGGGLTGYDGTSIREGDTQGYGGTQTYGGQYDGKFGKGGDSGSSGSYYLSSGGGSGYYGGGAGWHVVGAAGGSSFISGYSGCNAIGSTSTENNITHTGSSTHYSGKVFTSGVMIDGKGCNWSTGSASNCGANQIQPDGSYTTGHSGNGYARITYIGN